MSKSCLEVVFLGRRLCCLLITVHFSYSIYHAFQSNIPGPPAPILGSDRRAGYPVSRILDSVQGGGNRSRPSPRTHLQNPTFNKTTRIEGAPTTVPRGPRKHALFSQGTKRPRDRGFTVGYWHLNLLPCTISSLFASS